MTQSLVIDPEFQRLLPDLDASQLADLEADIIANGITSPLVVWAEEGILLDGHNRYAIATRNDLTFDVERRSFADRKAAADWIDRNQTMRRNLTPDMLNLVMGRRYNRMKLAKGAHHPKPELLSENRTAGATRDRLAEEHGVTRSTISAAGDFAKSVAKLTATVDPTLEKRVVSGHGPTRKVIAAAAAAETPEEAAEILTAEKPPPKRPPVGTLKEQNGYRVMPLRAAPLRAESATTSLETSIECLEVIDRATLAPFTDRLSAAKAALAKLIRSLS